MRYSLRIKLTVLLITIVSLVILLTWFLNFAFAEQFYELTEKKEVIQIYHRMEDLLDGSEEADQSGDKGDESGLPDAGHQEESRHDELKPDIEDNLQETDVEEEIVDMCNRANIRMMVTETDPFLITQNVLYTNMIAGTGSYNELLWYLNQIQTSILFDTQYDRKFSGRYFDQFSALESDRDYWSDLENDGYVVRRMRNLNNGRSSIYLFGYTDSGYLVGMVVPLESIKASAEVSSRFLVYIGFIGILVGSLAILIITTRFTKPIKDMAVAADRMAQLDFDARIDIDTGDELELLGDSMNTLSETLESTIADLKAANLELQKDKEKKEQIDEMRKEFLSHVSHELKTPIALIQGYAEGLSENIMDDEESKEFYCEVIADEAMKMNNMVQKLLTLNQIEFGNSQLEMQRFDICQLIHNKIQSSQILIMKNHNQVIFDQTEPIYVWADEFMIEEVFSNYFSNALHHVAPGGEIRVWIEKRAGDIRVHVFNEGSQIPEEDLEKLWIKFYKVDKARTREYGGSGIGLSIVAATMKAHGKEFGVQNTENGVDFYFDLDTE